MEHHSTTFLFYTFSAFIYNLFKIHLQQIRFMQIFSFQTSCPKPAGFKSNYLPKFLLHITISQQQSWRKFIQIPFSCYALSLNRALTRSKRALNIDVCIWLKLNISEPGPRDALFSKIFHRTWNLQKRSCIFEYSLQLLFTKLEISKKEVYLNILYNFCFGRTFKFCL